MTNDPTEFPFSTTRACSTCGQLTEIRFVLFLNDMRLAFEKVMPVAKAKSPEALRRWLEAERVAPYTDEGPMRTYAITWAKSFRKGGPLEWFTPPTAPWPIQVIPVANREIADCVEVEDDPTSAESSP